MDWSEFAIMVLQALIVALLVCGAALVTFKEALEILADYKERRDSVRRIR